MALKISNIRHLLMKPSLVSVIFGIGLIFHTASGAVAEGTAPVSIAVVKTWSDLLAQKPVTLQPVAKDAANQASTPETKKPLTLRLGIDRTNSKKRSGVLLYCLAQGDVAQIDQQTDLADPAIGPFLIDVRRPADQRAEALIAMVTDRFMISTPNALFMKPLPLDDAGAYIITVRQALGGQKFRNVASVKVIVSEDLGLSWSPWAEPKGGLQAVEMTDVGVMDVANPARGIALPKWDGCEPIFFSELPKGNRPLPEWIAAKPDPRVQLKRKGNDLIVKMDEAISIYFPDEHFLTRWWVNDKPFTPDPEPVIPMYRALAARELSVQEVHFRMEFHPEYLKLKKGDTVGVQLLFCPHGWDWTGPVQVAQQAQDAMASELAKTDEDLVSKPIARMSNRINFIYSGNPESPDAGSIQ